MQAGVRPGADEEFVREAAVFRGELLALCYRMLGSLHDAEDAVQEAYIRAWRGHERFDGRSTLRTWLYRITTRVCLRALEQAGRRPLPSGLAGPAADPEGPIGPAAPEVPWLQPFPTASDRDDPATIAECRMSMRLALVAALQVLPPRQRAVLILRDVLEWRAAEVASLLGATPWPSTAFCSVRDHSWPGSRRPTTSDRWTRRATSSWSAMPRPSSGPTSQGSCRC